MGVYQMLKMQPKIQPVKEPTANVEKLQKKKSLRKDRSDLFKDELLTKF
jgi:hypothetical protein